MESNKKAFNSLHICASFFTTDPLLEDSKVKKKKINFTSQMLNMRKLVSNEWLCKENLSKVFFNFLASSAYVAVVKQGAA